MNITKQYLKQVIKEELEKISEVYASWEDTRGDEWMYRPEPGSTPSVPSPFQQALADRDAAQRRAAAAAPKKCETCGGSGTPDMKGVSQQEAVKALQSGKSLRECPTCRGSGITK